MEVEGKIQKWSMEDRETKKWKKTIENKWKWKWNLNKRKWKMKDQKILSG